jgi:hypothetical protein
VTPVGVGRGRAGPRPGPGVAGQDRGGTSRGRARPSRTGAAPVGAGWGGPGPGVAEGDNVRRTCGGSDARGSDERERSGRKKERTQVLYLLMFIRLTHQPTNISGLSYVAAVVPYVRRPPDEHKLPTSATRQT